MSRSTGQPPTGDQLVELLGALANPLRLRVLAALARGPDYVSSLARTIGISRPLLHMHLQKLEAAGLVEGRLELSDDGKAMKFFDLVAFDFHLTPATICAAADSLTSPDTPANLHTPHEPPRGSQRKEPS